MIIFGGLFLGNTANFSSISQEIISRKLSQCNLNNDVKLPYFLQELAMTMSSFARILL